MPRNAAKASMWKNGHENLQIVTVMSSLHISGHREPCKQTRGLDKKIAGYTEWARVAAQWAKMLITQCEDQRLDSWHPCKWQEDYGVPPHCVIPVLRRRPSGQVSKLGKFMSSEYKRPLPHYIR